MVDIPNDNIKKQLVRNRLYDTKCMMGQCAVCPYEKIVDCTKCGVVYRSISYRMLKLPRFIRRENRKSTWDEN